MNLLQFIKNWTLPISMALGIGIYLLFAFTPQLDGFATWFLPLGHKILPIFMFLILFVIFCKVDFKKLRIVAWHFWVGVFQIVFSFMIVALIISFEMTGRSLILMESLLTCIIGPCAAAASVITAKLGGSMEEMTTYTFLSNIITAVLIPVCFPLIIQGGDITFIDAFLIILKDVCAVLLFPMLLAFIVKHTLHRFHQWIIGVKDLSYYLWGGSLVIVSGTTVRNIVHADTSIFFLISIAALGLIVCIIQFSVGRFVGHYFETVVESGQALGQKNTPFAIWIANTYMNPLSSVGPGCYILWQNIINSFEIWHYRKKGLIKQV